MLTGETKLFIGILSATVVVILAAILIFSRPEKTYSRDELIPPGTMTLGKLDAPNFLVEFSDYECPSCKAFQPAVNTILSTYKDNIVFAYRHYPLPQHPMAKKASLAALTAGIQGKYWEMHSYIFDHQEELSDETLIKGAETLELNMNQFQNDINQATISGKVEQDITSGNTLKITATPTFFLNGKRLTLNSYEDLLTAVKQIMK